MSELDELIGDHLEKESSDQARQKFEQGINHMLKTEDAKKLPTNEFIDRMGIFYHELELPKYGIRNMEEFVLEVGKMFYYTFHHKDSNKQNKFISLLKESKYF